MLEFLRWKVASTLIKTQLKHFKVGNVKIRPRYPLGNTSKYISINFHFPSWKIKETELPYGEITLDETWSGHPLDVSAIFVTPFTKGCLQKG